MSRAAVLAPQGQPSEPRERASLSVCCMTRGPGPRVAALLDTLRVVADEIVVAVDDRAQPSVIKNIGGVTDRVIVYSFRDSVDRPLPWLFDTCTGDWVLLIDDDEIPSLALVDQLPALLAADDVTHYWIPRRWLFPTTSSFLDEAPWKPDYQPRLLRRDTRFVRFSDEFHNPIAVSGPGRYLEAPLWHADTALRSYDDRLEKARRYERMRPGMRVGARALNFAFYVPELRPSARVAPVPTADWVHIDSVLEAEARRRPMIAELDFATRDEIDAHWPVNGRAAHHGRLELLDDPRELIAGQQQTLDVRVHNTGGRTWHWGWAAFPEIRLGSRWFDENGAEVRDAQLRTAFPADLPPGGTDVVPVHVRAPEAPGRYRIEIDLIEEHVRWFGAGAGCSVVVQPRRRIGVVGDDLSLLAVSRVLERVPEVELVAFRRAPDDRPDGYPQAVDAHPYLLDDAPRARPAFTVTLLWRAARLLVAAFGARLGRTPRLPRLGREFLHSLEACDVLVLAAPGRLGQRRERLHLRVMVASAALLDVVVVTTSDPAALLPLLVAD